MPITIQTPVAERVRALPLGGVLYEILNDKASMKVAQPNVFIPFKDFSTANDERIIPEIRPFESLEKWVPESVKAYGTVAEWIRDNCGKGWVEYRTERGEVAAQEAKEIKSAHEEAAVTEREGTPLIHENPIEVTSRNTSDCPIVALANVLQIPYQDAKIKCFLHGWCSTQGIERGFLELILEQEGYRTHSVKRGVGWILQDLKEKAEFQTGTFLIYVRQHVIPMLNGKMSNLAGSEWQVVEEIYEILLPE